MAKIAEAFSLYKRKDGKSKTVYYAKLRGEDGRVDQKRVSTGQTSKAAARLWVEKYLEDQAKEAEREEQERLNITFGEYAKDFWEHEGEYATDRRARLRTISYGYLDIRKGITRNHLIPKWGKYRLIDLSAKQVDNWVLDMADDNRIASGTVNQRLQTLKVILEFACSRGLINENPVQYVKPVAERSKRRGVLSLNEVKELLNPQIWKHYKHYTINLLTLSTGMRIGEIRGLQVHQVQPDHVQIHTAWEEGYGLKEPKYGSIRDIPISPPVYQALIRTIEITEATELVFHGARKETPLSKSAIENNLYSALAQIGIDEVERRKRNLTFHSHRHTLNTLMRSQGIPDAKIRLITGHREESMTERYTRFRLGDLTDIQSVQTEIVNGSTE